VYKEFGYAVIAGLGVGGMYAFIALGYTVILAASGVFSFAQGSIVMGGSLVMYWLFDREGWPVAAAIALIVAGGALVGMFVHVLSVLPVTNRRGVKNLTEGTLVTTFGLGLILNTIAGLGFGYDVVPVKSYITRTPVHLLGLSVSPIYLVMIGITLVVSFGLERLLNRTGVGLVLRVTVEDAEGARLGGVGVAKVVFYAFALGGGLAALAGGLLAPVIFASVGNASQLVLLGYAGMAIGGYGSFPGALLGGLVVGLVSTIIPLYINAAYVSLIIYGLMIVVLIFFPKGLFGTAGRFGSAALREV
jgi:branched-subunit amino acid ABC-type transport system permease component